jgi:hypothetical protein
MKFFEIFSESLEKIVYYLANFLAASINIFLSYNTLLKAFKICIKTIK